LRSVSPAQRIFFVLFFLIAVCGLKTQLRSTSFHYLSSAWIPEDINAAIAACFVFAINPFILTHTHWQ
jgi:hypothetical protein